MYNSIIKVLRLNNANLLVKRVFYRLDQNLRQLVPGVTVVGMDFRKFVRVACVGGLPLVPSNGK